MKVELEPFRLGFKSSLQANHSKRTSFQAGLFYGARERRYLEPFFT